MAYGRSESPGHHSRGRSQPAEAAAQATKTSSDAAARLEDLQKVGKATAATAVTAAQEADNAAAAKAATALAEAKTVGEAKKQLATIGTETGKVALAASDAATAAMDVVAKAVRPRLPVTSEQDDEVFEALRARITGGAIFFNGVAAIVPNEAGTAGVVRSDQFSQAATYLAFETQPRVWSFDWGFCCNPECRNARENKVRARGYNRF